LVVVATFYFTIFVPLAIGAGAWVWNVTASSNPTAPAGAPNVLLSGVLVGAVGLVCGFVGPIYFDAGNLGPLLGLFMTGPGGFILGIGTAVVLARSEARPEVARRVLGAVAFITAGVTLLLSIPNSRYVGDLLEATPVSCRPAVEAIPDAVVRWEQRFKEHPDWKVRSEWKEQASRMAAAEPAIVLTMQVYRHRRIDELRKPWNRGTIQPQPWQVGGAHFATEYFLRRDGGSCLGFELGVRQPFAIQVSSPEGTPPTVLHFFLGLPEVGPVPPQLRLFLEK